MTGTKFEHLGNLPAPTSREIKELCQRCMDGVSLGELSPFFIKKHHFVDWVDPLRGLIKDRDFTIETWPSFNGEVADEYHSDIIILPIRGSSGWHKDYEPEKALTLSWLIHCRPLISLDFDSDYSSPPPTLIVKSPQDTTVSEVRMGDVFVFDHQYHHVRVSNWQCVLVQMPLSLTSCS